MTSLFLELHRERGVLVSRVGPLIGRQFLIFGCFLARLNDLVIRRRRGVLNDAFSDCFFESQAHVHPLARLLQRDVVSALCASDQRRQPAQQWTWPRNDPLPMLELLVIVLSAPVLHELLVQ